MVFIICSLVSPRILTRTYHPWQCHSLTYLQRQAFWECPDVSQQHQRHNSSFPKASPDHKNVERVMCHNRTRQAGKLLTVPIVNQITSF